MPVRAPGSTPNNPPQMADGIPRAGAIAARRSEPGVCAVARSNCAGLTMWIQEKSSWRPASTWMFNQGLRQWVIGQPLNWHLVVLRIHLRRRFSGKNTRILSQEIPTIAHVDTGRAIIESTGQSVPKNVHAAGASSACPGVAACFLCPKSRFCRRGKCRRPLSYRELRHSSAS
jgi:hypothetical protein